jgi:hypothetical protein
MFPTHAQEIWITLLYCVLTWVAFSAAYYLADTLHRRKEAMIGGLIAFMVVSILMMLAGYASVFMGVGVLMSLIFQLCGVLLSVMAVSRVVQMLPWPRTWLAGGLALFFYLIVSTLIGWCFFL